MKKEMKKREGVKRPYVVGARREAGGGRAGKQKLEVKNLWNQERGKNKSRFSTLNKCADLKPKKKVEEGTSAGKKKGGIEETATQGAWRKEQRDGKRTMQGENKAGARA